MAHHNTNMIVFEFWPLRSNVFKAKACVTVREEFKFRFESISGSSEVPFGTISAIRNVSRYFSGANEYMRARRLGYAQVVAKMQTLLTFSSPSCFKLSACTE